jgi:hypothetical protein
MISAQAVWPAGHAGLANEIPTGSALTRVTVAAIMEMKNVVFMMME